MNAPLPPHVPDLEVRVQRPAREELAEGVEVDRDAVAPVPRERSHRALRVEVTLDRALDLLCNMEENGVDPDLISYSTAVSSCEHAGELASALEAYEAFVATVPADARPRPRRKPKARSVREEETSRGGFVPSAFARAGPERASAPERAAPERVVSRGAPAFTAPAFAKASSRAPAAAEAEGAPADAYPPAASSTKFFFYNPHSGFVRNGREDGGGESAAAEASAREASRPAETAARRRARIVDDIAPAPFHSHGAFQQGHPQFGARL